MTDKRRTTVADLAVDTEDLRQRLAKVDMADAEHRRAMDVLLANYWSLHKDVEALKRAVKPWPEWMSDGQS